MYYVRTWYVMLGRTSGPWYVQVRTGTYYVRTRDVHFPTLCTSPVRPWDVVKYVLCTSHVRTFQVRTFYVLFRTKTGCKMIESTYNVRTMDIQCTYYGYTMYVLWTYIFQRRIRPRNLIRNNSMEVSLKYLLI